MQQRETGARSLKPDTCKGSTFECIGTMQSIAAEAQAVHCSAGTGRLQLDVVVEARAHADAPSMQRQPACSTGMKLAAVQSQRSMGGDDADALLRSHLHVHTSQSSKRCHVTGWSGKECLQATQRVAGLEGAPVQVEPSDVHALPCLQLDRPLPSCCQRHRSPLQHGSPLGAHSDIAPL